MILSCFDKDRSWKTDKSQNKVKVKTLLKGENLKTFQLNFQTEQTLTNFELLSVRNYVHAAKL